MASPHEQPYLDPSDADLPPSELLVLDDVAARVMAKPHEQPEPVPSDPADADLPRHPVGELVADVLTVATIDGASFGPQAQSRDERQAAGYEAYEQATRLRLANGDKLDKETVSLYEKAANDLLSVDVLYGAGDRPKNPFNMLTRAECLGWLAEGTPYGVFYENKSSSHIDVKSNLQKLADEELEGANKIIHGGGQALEDFIDGQMIELDDFDMAEAAVEAADEAGTAEHVEIHGIGKVDEGISERLVAGGQQALARFTVENAMQAEHGGKFTAIMARKEVAAAHRHPTEATEAVAA